MEFQRDERVERRRARRRQIRRRRFAAGVVVLGVAGLIAVSTTNLLGPGKRSKVEGAELPKIEYPFGGTSILPQKRIVALFGAYHGGATLGRLGVGSASDAAAFLTSEPALDFDSLDRPVQPAFELIATLVTESPGEDGLHRRRATDAEIDEYLSAARQAGAIMILDIQPGHARWMDEVRAYEKYLRMPDVMLALDPEWSLPKGVAPGKQIGTIEAQDINEVSAYLQQLVDEGNLPQKILLVHQFKDYQLKHRGAIVTRPDIPMVLNMDGFGPSDQKVGNYEALIALDQDKPYYHGFKLFYDEDNRGSAQLMQPSDVLALEPQPDVIVYE